MPNTRLQWLAAVYLVLLFGVLVIAAAIEHKRQGQQIMDDSGCYMWSDGVTSCKVQP